MMCQFLGEDGGWVIGPRVGSVPGQVLPYNVYQG